MPSTVFIPNTNLLDACSIINGFHGPLSILPPSHQQEQAERGLHLLLCYRPSRDEKSRMYLAEPGTQSQLVNHVIGTIWPEAQSDIMRQNNLAKQDAINAPLSNQPILATIKLSLSLVYPAQHHLPTSKHPLHTQQSPSKL